ncbi:hypothetical protein ACFQNE_02650 [Gordonia phosphorivorans]|uniref:Uncharacterized protein n=1 Tax=Gordonia phosphorivorans TaxID=1056982 RepID=A0ABV6H471_9ACTN
MFLIVTSTEIAETRSCVEVPDHFDVANSEHRSALNEVLLQGESGGDINSRTLQITVDEAPDWHCDLTVDDDELTGPTIPSTPPTPNSWNTWTFFGHWEDSILVIDVVLAGEHATGQVSVEGVSDVDRWCAIGSGPTAEAVLAELRAEYENTDSE